MNRKVIMLFTSAFPFGKGEQFIETELKFLSESFSTIYIFPYFYDGNMDLRIQVPHNVTVFKPFRDEKFNFLKLLIKGIFNTKTLFPYFQDVLIHPQILFIPRNLSLWIRSLLNCRMILNDDRLKRCIREDKENIVFYFYWGNRPSGITAGLKKFKRPIVSRFHRADLYRELPINHKYIPFQELVMKNITHAVCISDHGAGYIRSHFKRHMAKISVHRLGTVDHGHSQWSASEKLRIISCSMVDENKRTELIARAISLLDFPIEWTHIGDGPLMDNLREYCNTLNKENIIINLKGRLANSEVHKIYSLQQFDIFINVSKSEGVPFSIMEALSYSLPVCATAAGGTSEIVDRTCGILLPVELNETNLGNYLSFHRSLSPAEKLRLRNNSRKRWEERCSAEMNYQKFITFLNNIGIRN